MIAMDVYGMNNTTVEYCECEYCGRLVVCRSVNGKMLCDRCVADEIIQSIVECKDCIYMDACPCGYSLHNAACLTIAKRK